MGQAKHTPGPWIADLDGPSIHWPKGEKKTRVADVFAPNSDGRDSIEGFANAALIAAAPDLLAACRLALEEMDPAGDIRECDDPDGVHDSRCWEAVQAVRAAIEAATKTV